MHRTGTADAQRGICAATTSTAGGEGSFRNGWRFAVAPLFATAQRAEMEARMLEKPRQLPSDGSMRWGTWKLARLLKINHNHVAMAWRQAGLQPHRFERYMQSDDSEFERRKNKEGGDLLKNSKE